MYAASASSAPKSATSGAASGGGAESFTTVWHLSKPIVGHSIGGSRYESRPIGLKRKMSNAERLYYLRHGLRPPTAPRAPTPPLKVDATAFADSKRRVFALVAARESALRAVVASLPHPADDESLRLATTSVLLDKEMLAYQRQQLARTLHSLRLASAAVMVGIQQWRAELRDREDYYASLPDSELKFFVHGIDYLSKMASDTHFLPLPTTSDPLLLHWFGEVLPWVYAAAASGGPAAEPELVTAATRPSSAAAPARSSVSAGRPGSASVRFASPLVPATPPPDSPTPAESHFVGRDGVAWRGPVPGLLVAAACELAPLFEPAADPNADVAMLALASDSPPSTAGGAGSGGDAEYEAEVAWLHDAQEALLAEAHHRGEDTSAEATIRVAKRAKRHAKGSHLAAWRWDAFQMLIYGAESYARLLEYLPGHHKWKTFLSSATKLQRAYRSRLIVRFMRVSRRVIDARRVREAAARRERLEVAASYVQRCYRGKQVRDVLRGLTKELLSMDKNGRAEALQKLYDKAEARERVKREGGAVRLIQRKGRMLFARSVMTKLLEEKRDAAAKVVLALSDSPSVPLLEALIERHKIAKGVLFDVYSQVCLSYELDAMQRETAAVRASAWFAQVQNSLDQASERQRGLETTLTDLTTAASRAAGAAATVALESKLKELSGSGSGVMDVLGVLAALKAEVNASTSRAAMLRAEVAEWERLKATAAKDPISAPTVKELLSRAREQIIEKQSALRAAQQARSSVEWRGAPAMEAGRTAPSAEQALVVLEGGSAAVQSASEWGAPGTLAQSALLAAVSTSLEAYLAAERLRTADVVAAQEQLADAEGLLAVIKELSRQYEGLGLRQERVRIANIELKDCGASISLTRLAASMPAADLAEELTPTLPPPPARGGGGAPAPSPAAGGGGSPRKGGTSASVADWGAWLQSAAEAHDAAAARLALGQARRSETAKEELAAAETALEGAESRWAAGDRLVHEWLLTEGSKRVFASVQGKERHRLRREMFGRRCAVFRRMYAQPTSARIQSKRASTELLLAESAAQLAAQVMADPVQARKYSEGEMRVTCCDRDTSAFTELLMPDEEKTKFGRLADGSRPGSPQLVPSLSFDESASYGAIPSTPRTKALSARDVLIRSLHLSITEGIMSERLYVHSVRRTTVPYSRSDGSSVNEPATCLVVCARRLPGEEKERKDPAAAALSRLADLYKDGSIGEALGVRATAIEYFEMVAPKEEVREAPTLLDLRNQASNQRSKLAVELDDLEARKSEYKDASRVWYRVTGALDHIQQLDAKKLVNNLQEAEEQAPTGATPRVPWGKNERRGSADDSVVMRDDSPKRFVSKWLGCGDIVRAHVALDLARKDKARRRELKEQVTRLDGRLDLIRQLQASCHEWPAICVPGTETIVDRPWNVGLEGHEDDHRNSRSAQYQDAPAAALAVGHVCYHCASLQPPVRVVHRFVDCPKRRRANMPEFRPEAMQRISQNVQEHVDRHASLLAELKATSKVAGEGAQEGKREILELAGAIKVLGKQDALMPRPKRPPPPPPSSRDEAFRTFTRRRRCDAEHLVKMMARSCRSDSMAIRGAWGELKATALMTPQPAPLAGPLQPDMIIDVARSIDLDVSESGSDHHLLHLVLELARAPLPPNWEPIEGDDDDDEEETTTSGLQRYMHISTGAVCVGHPAAKEVRKAAHGLRARSQRKTGSYKARPTESWVEFVDASEERLPFFYNFATGERRRDFPPLETGSFTPCMLPPRVLEQSAELLAQAGNDMWASVRASDALENAAKAALWDKPMRRARGQLLSHSPCQLEVIVQQGHALGLDASRHPELMWLAEAALTPELPMGWLRCSIAGAVGGESGLAYYWNAVSGLTQWEHPHVSLLTGVSRRLVQARVDEYTLAMGESNLFGQASSELADV